MSLILTETPKKLLIWPFRGHLIHERQLSHYTPINFFLLCTLFMPFIGNIYRIVSNSKVLWITLHKIALKCILRQVVSPAGVQCALFTVFAYTEAVCSLNSLHSQHSVQVTGALVILSPPHPLSSSLFDSTTFPHPYHQSEGFALAWKCFKLKTSCSELMYLDRWTWTVSCLAAQKDGSPAVFNDVAILSTLSLVCHFWHHHIFVGSQAFHIWCRHLLSIKTSSVCLMMFLATWTRTFSKYLI